MRVFYTTTLTLPKALSRLTGFTQIINDLGKLREVFMSKCGIHTAIPDIEASDFYPELPIM
jgi:hypothetical protein